MRITRMELVRCLGDRDLVARQDRHATPGQHLAAVHLDAGRVDPAAIAFPTERGDGARVGQEELRLPAPAQQLVQIIGSRRPAAGIDALLEIRVVQKPEVAVVDHLVFLPLAQRLDGQAHLLLDLVHRVVEQIRDAGMDLAAWSGPRSARTRAAPDRSRRRCPAAPARPCARRPARWRPARACPGASARSP